jgi:hypothetical protein
MSGNNPSRGAPVDVQAGIGQLRHDFEDRGDDPRTAASHDRHEWEAGRKQATCSWNISP